MTDYNPPDDTEIAPSKAIKATTGRRLRDMSIAIAEGATGAPRITQSALMAPESGSDYSLGSGSVSASGSNNTYSRTVTFTETPVMAGTVTVTLDWSSSSGSDIVTVSKNNSALYTYTDQSEHIVDISYAPGDSITVTFSVGNNDGGYNISGTYSFTSGTDCVRVPT